MSATRGSPEDSTLHAEAISSAFLSMFGATIGIVRAYDASTKTCDVQPAIRRPIEDTDGNLHQETPTIVRNVLVGQWGAAALSSHTVLAVGDAVLLVYLDYAPTLWRKRGDVSDTPDTHLRGPSYPVALPFFRPAGGPGADSDDSIGAPGGVRVRFAPDVVSVKAAPAGADDFVALKSAVDRIQEFIDGELVLGTPWGPTPPGAVVKLGPLESSNALKAGK